MDFAYLIVGISKNEEKDLKELYDKTHHTVYGLALSLVRDRVLARDITIETYRRVKQFANTYDTDINAEYWLLDITKNLSINALHDKDIHAALKEGKLDNVSKAVRDTVSSLKNDRGSIIVLKAMSGLSMKEIANLLWYYHASARNEYKRGLKELRKKDNVKRSASDILEYIRRDITSSAPDVYDQILSDKQTRVSFVSHEVLNLSEDEITFTDKDAELEYIRRLAKSGKSAKRARLGGIAAMVLVCVVLVSLVIYAIVENYKKNYDRDRYNLGYEIALVEVDGVVYFQNYKDKSKLYSFDLKTKKLVKLSDDFVKELVTDGEYLFYRNRNDGRIYRINKDGSDRQQISTEAGSSIFLYNDYIYYTSPDGISRMKKDGQDVELVYHNTKEDMFFYDIFVHDDTIFFSGGAGLGIYYLDETGEETEVNVLYFDEAYDLHILGGNIYFNTFKQHAATNRQIPMYRYDLDEKTYHAVSDINLNSSAYYINDKYLYIDGYVRSTSGLKKDQGLYRIDTETGASSLLIDRKSTDIYVSETFIYSYTTDNGGSLIAYDINDINKTIVIF
ncbi:MAG: DUF5050 domain-containing protein [Clostridia bacterium]|nr:DUF5050 domain-containing protein [Clostridia bacterium]